MAKEMVWKFDLTIFDGGAGAGAGGGDGGTGADAGVGSEAAVPTNPNRRNRKENPLANVRYGKQPQASGEVAQQAQEGTQPEDRESKWKAIKEEYNDFFGRDTSDIVRDRLKNSKQAEATLAKLAPVFEGLGKKYGKDASDLDGILAAYTDDDSLYEEDAAKAGMSVSAYKQLRQLQADNEASKAREARSQQEQHAMRVVQDFENDVKSVFPNADIRAEFQNPQFVRLTSPEVGLSAKDAYWLIHRAEIEAMSAQTIAQKAQQKLSMAIQSGMSRPVENGARNVSPALEIRDDPKNWSRADREEVKRRVRNGERIEL